MQNSGTVFPATTPLEFRVCGGNDGLMDLDVLEAAAKCIANAGYEPAAVWTIGPGGHYVQCRLLGSGVWHKFGSAELGRYFTPVVFVNGVVAVEVNDKNSCPATKGRVEVGRLDEDILPYHLIPEFFLECHSFGMNNGQQDAEAAEFHESVKLSDRSWTRFGFRSAVMEWRREYALKLQESIGKKA